ncbi:MAG: HAMP domain-containing histidine kinase [Actinomycetota bacterium]|nr:HAMP domain-containing histidine kinase [Actinomycetota bacterium]
MRRRLLIVSMTLVSVLLVALMVPLVSAYAADRTQDLYVNRLTDVTRFAVLAEDSLEGGFSSLPTDLERYTEVYGGTVIVTNANHEVVASSSADVNLENPGVSAAVRQALSGSGSAPPGTVWPWDGTPFVIGAPVGRDAQVIGGVVMISPTDSVQDRVGTALVWLVIAGLAALALTACGLVIPLVGWIIRPVHDLDRAVKRLADGSLPSRVPDQAGPHELQDLARSFNTMADSVATSQQQQRDLIANAAHQLGNPLTALRLRVENLATSTQETDEIDIVLEEADRLGMIVESLLDLSQVGAQAVEATRVDVAAKARHRCDMWSPMFDELRLDAPPSAFALATDDIVDVVLDALLDNAAKFAEHAPVHVTVMTDDPGDVVVRVRDHGPGLDADDVEKVGTRFFRGRQHQNVAGTGLGLAIVQARVLDVGGSFAVMPASGGGLQVEVRLPVFNPAVHGSSAEHPDEGPAAT